jgi:hypothetical protein
MNKKGVKNGVAKRVKAQTLNPKYLKIVVFKKNVAAP